jgi:hypothetical protein
MKCGGGVEGAGLRLSSSNFEGFGSYPSTMLRMVLLPVASRQGG